MVTLFKIIEWTLFFLLGVPVAYFLVFSLASLSKRKGKRAGISKQRRFIALIPAYKADAVILSTSANLLNQDYPKELYKVVVIADSLSPETLDALKKQPLIVKEVTFEKSSKAKALQSAVDFLGPDAADIVTIVDADNLVDNDFISRLNDAFELGTVAAQAHRTAKNRNTPTAVLDAASEEINNSIFRKGHNVLGLSSALIGSGMAFDYEWFRNNIQLCTTSGEDKELEILLLKQRIRIDYLEDVLVYDEKVQAGNVYYDQRRRWIAAQFYALSSAVKGLPSAIGNLDYFDKLVQWCFPPRMLLMGFIPLLAIIITIFASVRAIKWWILVLALFAALLIAVPKEQFDKKFWKALISAPMLIYFTFKNLFRLKGTKDNFIHTEHTYHNNENSN